MILIAFGTRPEYIKVKSLINNLSDVKTLFTGQHIDLLKDIRVDYSIEDMRDLSDNRLNSIIQKGLQFKIPEDIKYVLVQGDTTSALALAISAFNNGRMVIHLEAGLRTHNKNDPYPEELNRQLISRIAHIHLCPTELNKQNLINEKIYEKIYVVGNTGLDNINRDGCYYGNKILVTLHRRDNHNIMDQWFKVVSKLALTNPELEFILPIHPNPNVKKHASLLKGVNVIDGIPHDQLINIIKGCKFIISDSGGIQEEASYLNKKIIICRKNTERPEVLWSGHGILCEEPAKLESIFTNINNDYIINKPSPFGDGSSWVQIKKILDECLLLG
jgi:UDP-N-acetylglucosamine 2-epimerase (non-hydrolysing)